jgi:hypothetical protein
MSTPCKRGRKPSTSTAVLTVSDSEMIANKIVANLEKYLKLKNEALANSANAVAELRRV